MKNRKEIYQLVPEIDTEKCTFCKKCEEWCEFNAITVVPNVKFAEVNDSLCHSCGACLLACEYGAITERELPLGMISNFQTPSGSDITEGRLKVGSAMQTLLIKKLKSLAVKNDNITILDAPPGTSCPVVETIADADFVVLVAEPTPFGLHDLKITVELIEEIQIPFGVVVNKADLGTDDIYSFLNDKNIDLLGKIPFTRKYAELYSTGELLRNIPMETELIYKGIIEKIRTRVC